ncbi:hypothetical protein MALV_06800 [Mycolicibacterium alvei]|uniref:Uncharacterized protein n=1 Tax=Mycolicibacterium alvei TaxID=67081 RepID=A0A6N4UNP6_9MYCO|nr:hypothetical protein MALV_06800 [Mycolicibacterium alvei]
MAVGAATSANTIATVDSTPARPAMTDWRNRGSRILMAVSFAQGAAHAWLRIPPNTEADTPEFTGRAFGGISSAGATTRR